MEAGSTTTLPPQAARTTRLERMNGRIAESARADALRNRSAILDAAVDVLAVQPGASLAEVATRAGLGRATLYRHFENREALLLAIREEALSRAAAALDAANLDERSARDGIRAAAAMLVPLGVRFRILLAEGVDSDPDFLDARDRVLRPISGLIARGVDNDELASDVNPAWAAMVLGSLLVTAVRAVDAGLLSVEDAPDVVADTLFTGLGEQH